MHTAVDLRCLVLLLSVAVSTTSATLATWMQYFRLCLLLFLSLQTCSTSLTDLKLTVTTYWHWLITTGQLSWCWRWRWHWRRWLPGWYWRDDNDYDDDDYADDDDSVYSVCDNYFHIHNHTINTTRPLVQSSSASHDHMQRSHYTVSHLKMRRKLTPLATQNATCVAPMCNTKKNRSCLTKTLSITADVNGLKMQSFIRPF